MLYLASRNNQLGGKGRSHTVNNNLDGNNNINREWRFNSNLYSLRVDKFKFISFNWKLYIRGKIHDHINGDDHHLVVLDVNSI
jgi:hypothetical protein